MKQIKLSQGLFALVDDQDFEKANRFKWCAEKRGKNIINYYAKRRIVTDGKVSTQSLHVFLLGIKKGFEIDHANSNGLDNRRSNIRHCTRSQNMGNQRKKAGTSSIFKGVSFRKRLNKYGAAIKVNHKSIHIGYYNTAQEAAFEYDCAASIYFKNFARPNVVDLCYAAYLQERVVKIMKKIHAIS